nr:papain family cysteine protease [Pandoravirus massiliensis]
MSTLFASSVTDSLSSDDDPPKYTKHGADRDNRHRDGNHRHRDVDHHADRDARHVKQSGSAGAATPASAARQDGLAVEAGHNVQSASVERPCQSTVAARDHAGAGETRQLEPFVATSLPLLATAATTAAPWVTPAAIPAQGTHGHAVVTAAPASHIATELLTTTAAAADVPVDVPLLLPGPRPAFTILRQATPAAAREYAALPKVRPWRELARAVDPTGRVPLDAHLVWCGDAEGTLALPARFDGRRRWGRLLTPPSDQGLSGACWAYAVVSALGDRAALWTRGAVRPWSDGIPRPRVFGSLSARDLIDRDFDALTDAQSEGEAAVVMANQLWHGTRYTDYGHTLAGALEALYVDGVACHGGWRCRPLAYYGLAAAAEIDLKAEMFAWGPVASAFALYEDFMHPARYPLSWIGGVYRHDSDACRHVLGGHAVVLMGWCEAWLPDRRQHHQERHAQDTAAHRCPPTSKHTCWIARHAWGPAWAGAAHADGHFIMVAGQCDIEANVVACVPDIYGMSLDPRDAHRVAPPSSAARMRRAMSGFRSDADLLGPHRIDPALLPDMSAFVAGEVHAPDEGSAGAHHDNGAEYADGLRRPPSDAWATALRRAWTLHDPDRPDIIPQAMVGDAGLPSAHVPSLQGADVPLPHMLPDHGDGAMPFGAVPRPLYEASPLAWTRGDDNDDGAPFASPRAQDSANGDRRRDDGSAYHSNSDAELSEDERRLDAQHRLLRQGRRKRTQPRIWSDASRHRDAW